MLTLLLLAEDDPKAADTLTILYRRYSKLMYCEAYNVLKDPDDAQDAVADAFEGLLKVRRFPDPDSVNTKGLLVTICRRRALDIVRRKSRNELLQNKAVEETKLQGSYADADDVLAIAEAVAKLPEHLRSPLIKNLIEGYTTAEIAQMEGIRQNSVQKRIRKAKETIKQMLQEGQRQ